VPMSAASAVPIMTTDAVGSSACEPASRISAASPPGQSCMPAYTLVYWPPWSAVINDLDLQRRHTAGKVEPVLQAVNAQHPPRAPPAGGPRLRPFGYTGAISPTSGPHLHHLAHGRQKLIAPRALAVSAQTRSPPVSAASVA